jgi:hypothetical protein
MMTLLGAFIIFFGILGLIVLGEDRSIKKK